MFIMTSKILLVSLLITALVLSGCVNTAELQGKHKIETSLPTLLCDVYNSGEESIRLGFLSGCVMDCGGQENYHSFVCVGKYMDCYCEKNPNDLK